MNSDLRQVRPAVLEVGSRVTTGIGGSKKATVSFIGDTQFATGEWIGLTYDGPDGKNDGSQGGIFYFRCKPAHGAFVKRVSTTTLNSIVTCMTSLLSEPKQKEINV